MEVITAGRRFDAFAPLDTIRHLEERAEVRMPEADRKTP